MADRAAWVDLGSLQRLAARVATTTVVAAEDSWRDPLRPVLGRHWVLADHDWHRRRTWTADGVAHEETDHQHTRYALLPDGRLVRATTWRSEAGAWQGDVRTLAARDVRVLDQRAEAVERTHGTTTTWGVQPSGAPEAPWAGARLEQLLKALLT